MCECVCVQCMCVGRGFNLSRKWPSLVWCGVMCLCVTERERGEEGKRKSE